MHRQGSVLSAVQRRDQSLVGGDQAPCDPQGARRGVFALQLHSGGPTEVRYRNLRLEVIGDP